MRHTRTGIMKSPAIPEPTAVVRRFRRFSPYRSTMSFSSMRSVTISFSLSFFKYSLQSGHPFRCSSTSSRLASLHTSSA